MKQTYTKEQIEEIKELLKEQREICDNDMRGHNHARPCNLLESPSPSLPEPIEQKPIGWRDKRSDYADGMCDLIIYPDRYNSYSDEYKEHFTPLYDRPKPLEFPSEMEDYLNKGGLEYELNAFANHVLLKRKLNNSNEIAEIVSNYLKTKQ